MGLRCPLTARQGGCEIGAASRLHRFLFFVGIVIVF